jgi:hypothetical protein
MKAYQRVIRENAPPESDEEIKRAIAKDFSKASVREVDYATAKELILRYEWLRSMGSTRWSFGIFFGEHLGGICCYGTTAGNRVAESIAGIRNAHCVCTLVRGACLPWTSTGTASYLISHACRMMAEKYGKNLFVAYADERANEVGQINASLNWIYTEPTRPAQQFVLNGKIHDSRQVSGLARDRRGGTLKYHRSRSAQKLLLLEQGAIFMPGAPKHRYVGIYGSPGTVKRLRRALKLPSLPYPKRQG